MRDYPKPVKKKLRELVRQAYENELSAEMAKLAQSFAEWQAGTITVWTLDERIHRYHNRAARELWSYYNDGGLALEVMVASALQRGFLKQEGIAADVWPYVERVMKVLGLVAEEEPDTPENEQSMS